MPTRPLAVGYTYEAPNPSPYPVEFTTESGVTGDPVTSIADTVSGLTLNAFGTPTLVSGPGTEQYIQNDSGDYMEKADGVGDLPTGASPRTVVMACSFQQGQWGGFAWGANATEESFGIICDGFTNEITVDWKDGQLANGISIPAGTKAIVFGTYDGSTASLYLGTWLIDSFEVSLNTGSDRINWMRSYGGLTQDGDLGFVRVYDSVLTPLQMQAVIDGINAKFLAITTPPNVSLPTFTATGSTTGTAAGTIDQINSRLYGVIATGAKPTGAQIRAGTDALGNPVPSILQESDTESYGFSADVTGLSPSTSYKFFFFTEDPYGNVSLVQETAADTTPDNDITPTLIAPASVLFNSLQPVGEVITTFSADQPNCTFSKTAGATQVAIAANGEMSLTSAMSSGSYTVTVRADNTASGGGTYDQVITISVTEGIGTADYQTADWSTLSTLLQGWGGTVPDGNPVTVQIQGPSTNIECDLSGLAFDHLVTIINANPDGETMTSDANGNITADNGCKLKGALDIENSSNIRFVGLYIEKNPAQRGDSEGIIKDGGSSDITYEACYFSGTPWPHTIDEGAAAPAGSGVIIKAGGTGRIWNHTYTGCLFAYADIYLFGVQNAVNLTVEDCCFQWVRNDVAKSLANAYSENLIWRRNWSVTRIAGRTGAHFDHHQYQGGEHFNPLFWGNVIWCHAVSPNSYLHGQQCYFMQNEKGPSAMVDFTYEQNIIVGQQQNGIIMESRNATTPTTGLRASYNTCVISELGARGSDQSVLSGGSKNPYFRGPDSGWGTDYVIEHNIFGDPIAAGSDVARLGATDIQFYTGQQPFYDNYNGFISSGYFTDRPTSDTKSFGWSRPSSSSSVAHWDFNGQKKGAYLRMKEIHQDGRYPKAWPCKEVWDNEWNLDGAITG